MIFAPRENAMLTKDRLAIPAAASCQGLFTVWADFRHIAQETGKICFLKVTDMRFIEAMRVKFFKLGG
jgi:hypothetical protein